MYANIEAINKTNPTRYYVNDVLRFSWTVKHAENGSYGDAKDVKIVFYFSKFLEREDNGGESGLTTDGSLGTTTENGRTVLTYTYTGNGGTLAEGKRLLTYWKQSLYHLMH